MSKHESAPRYPFHFVDPTLGQVSFCTRYECGIGFDFWDLSEIVLRAEAEIVALVSPVPLDCDFLEIFLDLMRKGEVASDSFAKARREN